MQLGLNRSLQTKNRSQLRLSGKRDCELLQLTDCGQLQLRGWLQHWDWCQLQLSRRRGVETAGAQEQGATAALGPGNSGCCSSGTGDCCRAPEMGTARMQLKLGVGHQ